MSQRVADECNRLGALVADLQQQLAEAKRALSEESSKLADAKAAWGVKNLEWQGVKEERAFFKRRLAEVEAYAGQTLALLAEAIEHLDLLSKGEQDDPDVGITGWNDCHRIVAEARKLLADRRTEIGTPRQTCETCGTPEPHHLHDCPEDGPQRSHAVGKLPDGVTRESIIEYLRAVARDYRKDIGPEFPVTTTAEWMIADWIEQTIPSQDSAEAKS